MLELLTGGFVAGFLGTLVMDLGGAMFRNLGVTWGVPPPLFGKWLAGRGGTDALWWPTQGPGNDTCSGWTTTSGFAKRGLTNRGGPATGYRRWDIGGGLGCTSSERLVCLVHPAE